MALWHNDGPNRSQIAPVYNPDDFRNVVDLGPILDRLKPEDLRVGLERECGQVLDIQIWITNGTKRRHAFITFSSVHGATAALKSYSPPSWWNGGRKPMIIRFNYPQDLTHYKPVFQPRSDQENLLRGPSLSVSTTRTRHSTSTSPSTAPVDTPISIYSPEEPSCTLSYAEDKDRTIASFPAGRREKWPAAAPTSKGPSTESKVLCQAFENLRGDMPSRVEEHDQGRHTRAFNHTTKPHVTANRGRERTEERIPGSSSVRPSSGERANVGKPMDSPSGDSPGRVSSGKEAGQRAAQARVEEFSSLEAKVTETKARVEELIATRQALDEELNELASEKEGLQDRIAHYVKVNAERSTRSLKSGPTQHCRPRMTAAPSKYTEGATSILSALFLLHSIAISDAPR